jgi:predicted metal-dependent phosphoesterase TrpH
VLMPYKNLVISHCVLAILLSLSSTAYSESQCESMPDLKTQSIAGTLSRADFESYLQLPFEVPDGTKRITVDFSYDRSERTTVDLGLLDPLGFRGWSGGNKNRFVITQNYATPSYNAGPIVAGDWHVLLGVPNIREGQVAGFSVEITLECRLSPDVQVAAGDRGVDWDVGDLHAHTAHSDGSCDSLLGESVPCPVYLSLEAAAREKLDFISITEHNSTSQIAMNLELQSYFDSVLLVPGREVTTFYGHANVFGTTEFIDFRLQAGSTKNADYLHSQVEELGALMSINHPGSASGEDCMGCGWVLDDTDYAKVRAMEIVNVGYVDMPRGKAHIDFWEQRLNEGHKITGIAGSDNHRATRPRTHPSAIGNPRTWIFANNLSVSSLVEGIRSGKVYVDASGGAVRLNNFTVGGAEMGEDLAITEGPIALMLNWQSDESLSPVVIHQGEVLKLNSTTLAGTSFNGELDFAKLTLPGWVRVNLVNENGAIRLLSNPIYLEFK